MKKLLALWAFLNNKKTTIGAIMLLIPQALTAFGYVELSGIAQDFINILIQGGIAVTTVGLTHKGAKGITKKLGR